MNQIKEIEQLIINWKIAEDQDKAWGLKEQEMYAKGKRSGLEAALKIIRKQVSQSECYHSFRHTPVEFPVYECRKCGRLSK